jgi:hypothetical protein
MRAPSTYEEDPWRTATGFPLNQPWTPRPATPSARGGVAVVELFPPSTTAPLRVRPQGVTSHLPRGGSDTASVTMITCIALPIHTLSPLSDFRLPFQCSHPPANLLA